MILVIAVAVLLAATLLYTLFVRPKDLPVPDPVSPTQALDERKAAIYENLRDLQFEYRVGKLSDTDYAQTKLALQKELAVVIEETERVIKGQAQAIPLKPATKTKAASASMKCPHCGTVLPKPMKFCGECGKSTTAVAEAPDVAGKETA